MSLKKIGQKIGDVYHALLMNHIIRKEMAQITVQIYKLTVILGTADHVSRILIKMGECFMMKAVSEIGRFRLLHCRLIKQNIRPVQPDQKERQMFPYQFPRISGKKVIHEGTYFFMCIASRHLTYSSAVSAPNNFSETAFCAVSARYCTINHALPFALQASSQSVCFSSSVASSLLLFFAYQVI